MVSQLLKAIRQFPLWQRYAHRADLRKIAANALWLAAGYVLRLGVGVIVGAWVARYLGPIQYGALTAASALVALFTPLIGLGLERIIVRELAADATRRDELLGTAFALKLGSSLLAVPILAGLASLLYTDKPLIPWIVLLFSTGTLFTTFDTVDFWFQSQVSSKYTVQARNAIFLLVTAARVIGVLAQAPLAYFALVSFGEMAASGIMLAVVYRRTGGLLRAWRASMGLARRLIKDSWPLIFDGLAIMIYARIDQTLLGVLIPGEAGTQAVGVYGAAVRLSEIWYFVPMALCNSVFPTIIQSYKASDTLFRARMQRLFNLMVLLTYAVAIPTTLLSGWIISTLYGEAYRDAAPMLAVLVWAGLWVSLGVARNTAIQAENRLTLALKTSLLGAAVNLGLNLLLIPSMAGLGAAIATLVSYAVSGYLGTFLFRDFARYGHMQTRALLFPNPFRVIPSAGDRERPDP